jgi:hypothetical protein
MNNLSGSSSHNFICVELSSGFFESIITYSLSHVLLQILSGLNAEFLAMMIWAISLVPHTIKVHLH